MSAAAPIPVPGAAGGGLPVPHRSASAGMLPGLPTVTGSVVGSYASDISASLAAAPLSPVAGAQSDHNSPPLTGEHSMFSPVLRGVLGS